MPPSAVVTVGASAGGVEALQLFVAGLPADLDAAVLVVLHIPRRSPSALPHILRRSGRLPAADAVDGDPLEAGRVYVAPSDHHLLVVDGHARLSRGPSENGHRPAIDALFRSAARAYGPHTVAVVLSGSGDDGAAGAAAVAARGGQLLVQDPDDALHSPMPRNALEAVPAARAVPAAALGTAVADLVKSTVVEIPGDSAVDRLMTLETAMARMEDVTAEDLAAKPAGLGCPSCNGALFELPGEPSPRFRCRIGHAWSPQSLLDEQFESMEGALWVALRSLREKGALSGRLAGAAGDRGQHSAATRYLELAAEADEAARLVRKLITHLGTPGTGGMGNERVE